MTKRLIGTTALCGLLAITGCSYLGYINIVSDDSSSGSSGSSSGGRESYVRVWIDNNPATMSEGDARCKINSAISHGPKIKYEITEPEKIGKITNVTINMFHEFDGGWSQNVDFIVIASDTNNPDAQMKPGREYHLGSPGDDLKIMDGNGNTLERITLTQGTKYLMNFVVRGDRSETVSIEFSAM